MKQYRYDYTHYQDNKHWPVDKDGNAESVIEYEDSGYVYTPNKELAVCLAANKIIEDSDLSYVDFDSLEIQEV